MNELVNVAVTVHDYGDCSIVSHDDDEIVVNVVDGSGANASISVTIRDKVVTSWFSYEKPVITSSTTTSVFGM